MWAFPILFFCGFIGFVWWMQGSLKRQGYRPGQRPPSRSIDHGFDPANSVKLRGGARIGRYNATVPLVPLNLDHEWANLSGFVSLWIGRNEVDQVRHITGLLGSGIMFATPDGHLDGVIFWTFDARSTLDAFQFYDWPVEPIPPPRWATPAE